MLPVISRATCSRTLDPKLSEIGTGHCYIDIIKVTDISIIMRAPSQTKISRAFTPKTDHSQNQPNAAKDALGSVWIPYIWGKCQLNRPKRLQKYPYRPPTKGGTNRLSTVFSVLRKSTVDSGTKSARRVKISNTVAT